MTTMIMMHKRGNGPGRTDTAVIEHGRSRDETVHGENLRRMIRHRATGGHTEMELPRLRFFFFFFLASPPMRDAFDGRCNRAIWRDSEDQHEERGKKKGTKIKKAGRRPLLHLQTSFPEVIFGPCQARRRLPHGAECCCNLAHIRYELGLKRKGSTLCDGKLDVIGESL